MTVINKSVMTELKCRVTSRINGFGSKNAESEDSSFEPAASCRASVVTKGTLDG